MAKMNGNFKWIVSLAVSIVIVIAGIAVGWGKLLGVVDSMGTTHKNDIVHIEKELEKKMDTVLVESELKHVNDSVNELKTEQKAIKKTVQEILIEVRKD